MLKIEDIKNELADRLVKRMGQFGFHDVQVHEDVDREGDKAIFADVFFDAPFAQDHNQQAVREQMHIGAEINRFLIEQGDERYVYLRHWFPADL